MNEPERPRRGVVVPSQGGSGLPFRARRGTDGSAVPRAAEAESPEEEPEVRILVVDDTAEVRMLVGILLSDEPSWTVVAEAANGAEAISCATESRPDLVLLDLSMPVMDGLEALPALRRLLPDGLIVILTAFPVADVVEVARASGADAALDKVDMATRLVPALRALIDGRADRAGTRPGGRAGSDGRP